MTEFSLHLAEVVETGAREILARRWAPEPTDGIPVTAYDRELAVACIEAAAPLIEKAVREKVAQEIEARRDQLAEDCVWENEGRAYLEIAAAIARGTGSGS